MKSVKLTIGGEVFYLAFTGEAMFQIQDDFGGVSELLEAIKPDTRDGLRAACVALALLAEQGALARRYYGHSYKKTVTAEGLLRIVSPADIIAIKRAIPQAISLGYGREIQPENDEVDLGLAELEQKKTH